MDLLTRLRRLFVSRRQLEAEITTLRTDLRESIEVAVNTTLLGQQVFDAAKQLQNTLENYQAQATGVLHAIALQRGGQFTLPSVFIQAVASSNDTLQITQGQDGSLIFTVADAATDAASDDGKQDISEAS